MTDTNILLTTGRIQPKQTAGLLYASSSGYGSLRTAQVESPNVELTRAGRRFVTAQAGAITGIAPVQAIPTTAAQWTLFNTSATDSIVIESLGVELASGTAAAGSLLFAAFFTLPVQTGLGTNIQVVNRNGSSTRTSAVAIKSGVTITTPAAPIWWMAANSDTANTGVLSVACKNDRIRGSIIIPPLYGLGLATLSGAGTTPLFYPTVEWTEFALDLE